MTGKFGRFCLFSLLFICLFWSWAPAEDDISASRSCNFCGMDRKAYGYSRMVVVYEDGTRVGTCSIHCTVTELQGAGGRTVKSLLVADRNSRNLVNAKEAVWVIGGKKKGVMTQRPKWAFATRPEADAFIAANGGVLADWDTAFAAAREDAAPQSRR